MGTTDRTQVEELLLEELEREHVELLPDRHELSLVNANGNKIRVDVDVF
jgi:hypothetical protein